MMGDTAVGKEVTIPFFNIQCDWEQALSKCGGVSWVSVRHPGEDKSTHGELKCETNPSQASPSASQSFSSLGKITTTTGPFSVVNEKSSSRFITVKNDNTECTFVATGSEFNQIHKSSIICMDVSEGGLGVSLCNQNKLQVWESGSGTVRRELQSHPIDAYTCRFFPSGLVILSGGSDCCLKIWSVEDGQCPVTLMGHKGAVQDTCVVERGRNIISVSKDGTAKLWDCGESKCLATLFTCGAPINACTLMTPTDLDLGRPVPHISDREVLTEGKLLIVVREDSKACGVGVASRKTIFSLNLPSAGNCCIPTGVNSFAVGCQGGQLVLVDVHNLSQTQVIQTCTTSPILDLLVHPKYQGGQSHLVWAAKSDGSCVLINTTELLSGSKETKMIVLTGPDCDPVYRVQKDLNHIYTCCRDGIIRKYSLNMINKFI